jgi:hypothetical protein
MDRAKGVSMKSALVLLVVFLGVAVAGVSPASGVVAGEAIATPTVKVASLEPVGSGVRGLVLLAQRPQGGSFVLVVAFGLQPNTEYGSFYYDDNACQVDPELVGTFTSNRVGGGFVSATIDEDVDEVGSISVRTPDYSTLFACADTSG